MSRSAVSGLQSALRLYESDKVRERSEGQARIREIFSNWENLDVFQHTASRDGGAGWIAFFQCLFQVVVLEKKACLRKSSGPQAERRLADAISLVRWMAERSVHLVSRKPFLSLVTHMTHLLVFSTGIFPPAALDYAKALRTLLSYPPHLDNLDQTSWKVLMGICWAALLGDEVNVQGGWDEVDEDEEDGTPGPGPTTQAASLARGRSTVTQATNELAMLVPILLSSPNAPILPTIPLATATYEYEPSLGLSILHKIRRFFAMHPAETSSHLSALRSLNYILASLELNCRNDFITGGHRILPYLVELWGARNKAVREQVLIALRTLAPYLTMDTARDTDGSMITRTALERLLDFLPKETTLRWGFEPIDIGVVRLALKSRNKQHRTLPFETRTYSAGHDFTHDCALRWATLELYADVGFHLATLSSDTAPFPSSSRDVGSSKRRKVTNALASLVEGATRGSNLSRLHALQVIFGMMDRHWEGLQSATQAEIRKVTVSLLEDDSPALQSWAFIGVATLASLSPDSLTAEEEADYSRAWSHAVRKSSYATLSRPACHAAHALLAFHKVNSATAIRDIQILLQSVDIQGPPYPHDSVCGLLDIAISLARQDVRLYAMGLEDKVISWLAKWNVLDGTMGKNRLDHHCPADVLPLFCNVSHLTPFELAIPTTESQLPEGSIVDRILEEHRTQPIRHFLLSGQFVESFGPPLSQAQKGDGDILEVPPTFLEGRPRRLSDVLTSMLDVFSRDWPSNDSGSSARPAISPDRARRTVDLVVLAVSFQATLRLNNLLPDDTCLQAIAKLLNKVTPTLSSAAYDVAAQRLMWSGLEPIVHMDLRDPPVWPVYLKPGAQSGIRYDLLPPPVLEDEDYHINPLLFTLWSLSHVNEVLATLFDICLDLFSGSTDTVTLPPSTQYPTSTAIQDDDDDFGEIRNAEADVMPVSKDVMDIQGTSTVLLNLLAGFRLCGARFLSANRAIPKDTALINAFLSLEGPRMVQVGNVLCDSVKHGFLRLNAGAVDLILSTFEDSLDSYAYRHSPSMWKLALDFMTVSVPVWLASESELAVRMIDLAKRLHSRISSGLLISWKVRLALVMFVDEYLDYDPDMAAWSKAVEEEMDVDESPYGATDIISGALVDIDMRVRFRAATSTAGLLYLTSIPVEQHLPFYHGTVDLLPREPKNWDSFITDILWKFNCCITSPQLRAATIYHLYEVPSSTFDFNHHLESGLETVAKRLGLRGIAPLYLAYAPLVISSQVFAAQPPMRVPPQLYGFATRKAYAIAALHVAASSVLLASLAEKMRKDLEAKAFSGAGEILASLCDAAGMSLADVAARHLATTAARAMSDPHSGIFADPSTFSLEKVIKALGSLPGLSKSIKISDQVQTSAEDISTNLFALLDLVSSTPDIAVILDASSPKAAKVFSALTAGQEVEDNTIPALAPSAGIEEVLHSLAYLTEISTTMSPAKLLFNTLTRLFQGVNAAFLVSEQSRYLRSVALVIALYSENMTHPSILGFFLRETLPLLKLYEIGGRARVMLSWGLEQVRKAPRAPDELDEIIVGLGSVYQVLQTKERYQNLSEDLAAWIKRKTSEWQSTDGMKPSLLVAKSTWPEPLKTYLEDIPEPTFEELCESSEKVAGADVLSMCDAMVKAINYKLSDKSKNVLDFQTGSFWKIKQHLGDGGSGDRGVSAFIDLLYLGHGQVHPPTLDAIAVEHQDSRLFVLRTRPKEDPSPLLRAAIVDKIVGFTKVDEFKTRSTALSVLQALLPHMAELVAGPLLSGPGKDILPLLIPVSSAISLHAPTSFATLVRDDTWIERARSTDEWMSALARLLCGAMSEQQPFFAVLSTIFDSMQSTTRSLLPLLVQSCLSIANPAQKEVLKERIRSLSTHFTAVLSDSSCSTETLRAIVDIVLHLRHYQPPYRGDELGYDAWLEIDTMLLSEAALQCGSFVTALMFLELTRSDKKNAKAVDLYDPRVQRIMYDTYSNVEDPDGFYGIKTTNVGDALQRRLEHEGQYWRSFGLYSASLESTRSVQESASTSLLAMRTLHNLGFNRVSSAVYGSLSSATEDAGSQNFEPLLFELAWRTGDWDLPVPNDVRPSSESLLYSSLRAVHRECDLSVARKIVSDAVGTGVKFLRECGVERMTQIKKTITELLCLQEIVKWLDPDTQVALDDQLLSPQALSGITTLSPSFAFSDAERLIATRRSLLSAAKEREGQDLLGDIVSSKMETLVALEKQCLLRLGEMARSEGNIQASINALVSVQQLELGETSTEASQDEFSQVLWAQQEHVLAIQHVEERLKVVKALKDRESGSRQAVLLGRMAKWTSKAKLRAPVEVSVMFEEAVRISQAHKLPTIEQSRVCHDYAAFADQQQAALYHSPDLERLNTYRDRKAAELRSATPPPQAVAKRTTKSSTRNDITLHLEREIREDEDAINRVLVEASAYANTALKMYATALSLSDEHDDSTTRMCALWLDHDRNETLNSSFERYLTKVPSHKFIFLSPQLAARLDKPKVLSAFNASLNGLVLRICQQHPYHILYQVITLADGVRLPSKGKDDANADGRGAAAAAIIATIASDKQSPLAVGASSDMRRLAEASISWCLSKSQEEESASLGRSMATPNDCPLRTLPKLRIPVATVPPPIDPLCEYKSIPTIARYSSTYAVLGGIHRPKKMHVYDTNGRVYKELFKGEDELRQDAVMEQVFGMSNKLLERDRKTKARALRFRTYVVIPMARKTGIMEFVGDSQAIGDWLKPAHSRYGKINGDIPAEDFRRQLKPIQEKEKNWDQLPVKFSQMKQHFHPVMRHFFMEKHRDPVAWFSMRLNYTRSVAVTSMVGWVLGIGDRHCSNILIDQKSGELVHIDFGIVFEDGQRLRVPEKVPFRLTSDIVDGFGLSGVDGTFRMCSEHTLRVLRESAELIMTVLEVFKHDPLYEWDAAPEKLQRAQGGGRVTAGGAGTSASALEKADRILGTIRGKLRDDLSIEYTVNQLIQEARDIDNLAKIFVGWQPWF